MKKKIFATMMAIMTVVSVSGCGNKIVQNSKVAPTEVVDTLATEAHEDEVDLKEQCLARAQYGDILSDLSWGDEPLAPSVIIEDYVSGEQKYLGQYYTELSDGSLCATVYLGDERIVTRKYFPGATCGAVWTPQSLVESYKNQTLPWKESDYGSFYYLYTEDYRRCFEIVYNDWLYVDEVKVMPTGQIAFDNVDIGIVIDSYQSGQWDGTVPLFSSDYGTNVRINGYYGVLEYEYEELIFDDQFDVDGLARKEYDDPPAFMTTGVDSEYGFEIENLNSYNIDIEGAYSGRHINATVGAYVDLPNASKDGFENLLYLEYAGPNVGMYVMMLDRIELYRRGVLMNTWECDITADRPELIYYTSSQAFKGETHARISDEEIVRLLPGEGTSGKVETVLDGMTREFYDVSGFAMMELSLKDGKLSGYDQHYGVVNIADGIVSIDNTEDIALMTGEDGLCYAFFEDDYMEMTNKSYEAYEKGERVENVVTVYCLGSESWERYLELYKAGLLEAPAVG